jgi:hypothetical protein
LRTAADGGAPCQRRAKLVADTCAFLVNAAGLHPKFKSHARELTRSTADLVSVGLDDSGPPPVKEESRPLNGMEPLVPLPPADRGKP